MPSVSLVYCAKCSYLHTVRKPPDWHTPLTNMSSIPFTLPRVKYSPNSKGCCCNRGVWLMSPAQDTFWSMHLLAGHVDFRYSTKCGFRNSMMAMINQIEIGILQSIVHPPAKLHAKKTLSSKVIYIILSPLPKTLCTNVKWSPKTVPLLHPFAKPLHLSSFPIIANTIPLKIQRDLSHYFREVGGASWFVDH